ncbi:MAG: M50 family metallopeptidase [Candidatus Phosphoribacter sp.]
MSNPPPDAVAQHGWLLGRVAGIPIYLGKSWPVIGIIIVLTFGPSIPLTAAVGYAVAAAYAVLLLVSVLVHEAGHAAAARATGARVDRIVANLWGGHTVFGTEGRRPGTAAGIAVAGPAGNLVLAAVGWLLYQTDLPPILSLLSWALAFSNLFVALFNLLPGLPLDGGFVVEALVWKLTGDRALAMVVAGWLGRVVTIGVALWFVVQPMLQGQTPSILTMVWIGLIGAFLWQGATQAIRSGTARRKIAAVPLSRVIRPVIVVPAHVSAATVVDALVDVPEAEHAVLVDPAGAPVGFLDLAGLAAVPEERLPIVPAAALLVRPRPGWVVEAQVGEDMSAVVAALAGHQPGESVKEAVLVRDPSGRICGTVSLAAVDAALREPT